MVQRLDTLGAGHRRSEGERDLRVDELLDVLGQLAAVRELSGELAGLLRSGDLTGHEEPQHTLWQDLFAARRRRQLLLAFGYGEAVEANALCDESIRMARYF